MEQGFSQEVMEATENQSLDLTLKQSVATFPLKKGGASFKTHKLVKESNAQYSFRPTIGIIIFCSLFIFIGLGLLVFFRTKMNVNNSTFDVPWVVFIVGLVFLCVGSIFLYISLIPRVFNLTNGIYFKSLKSKLSKSDKDVILLSRISALQIIGEHVQSDDNSYKSFELNIVESDGTRTNVVDHGNLKSLIKDAQDLSSFLKIPIWHATSHVE